jgi:CheY-like chemotaxis protein
MSKLNSILLIEDDSITNFINERLLRKLEIADDIKVASNGLEAISIIQDSVLNQQSSPSLIFLDINMPVMDGFEFLSEFKMLDIPNKENVLVIVLTTSTNLSDIEKLKGSGNTDFINKPLTKEKVQSILEKYFPEVAQDLRF